MLVIKGPGVSTTFYLDLANSLLSGHLKGVSVLGTQEELHLDAEREHKLL